MCECKCGRCHDSQNGDDSKVINTNADGFKIDAIDTTEKGQFLNSESDINDYYLSFSLTNFDGISTEITVLASVHFEKDNEDNQNGIFDRMKIKINSCTICHGVLRIGRIKSTICGHVFCGVCVDTAVRFRKKCPLCAQSVSIDDSHLLFV